jgi:cytochrome c6
MSRLQKLLFASVIVLTLLSPMSPVWASDLTTDTAAQSRSGSEIFVTHCVGCHPNGGNIIRRWKGLHQGALRRNQVNSVDAIATLVRNGKGLMSAYANRLTEDEIQTVAAYVFEQAENDWK